MLKHLKLFILFLLLILLFSTNVFATTITGVKIPVNDSSIAKYSNISNSVVREVSNTGITYFITILLLTVILVLLIICIIRKNHNNKKNK